MIERRNPHSGRNILLVGAGAVGQAYGWHLQQAGCRVSFFIKPHHRADLESGVDIHCLNGSTRGSHRFEDFGLMEEVDAVAAETWDEVWLCMSSTGLQGPWLDPLLAAVGACTVVTLQPGLNDREYLLERVPAERLVCGMIALVSYLAPLPGEDRPEGMTWWFPPLSPSPFSGPEQRVKPVVEALKCGGCPARPARDVRLNAAFGSALLMPLIAALEVADWSFAQLRSTAALGLASRGGRQASALAAPGRRRWLACLITHPLVLRIVIRVAPWVVPIDFETYLRVHFTKVGDQTRAMLKLYCEMAESPDDAEALQSLFDQLT
jgi:2-dehydropantoate 2-reductase